MSDDEKSRFRIGMAILIVFAGYIVILTMWGATKLSDTMIGVIIGYTGSNAQSVVQFYFGSSKSSANKDAVLAQAVTTSAEAKNGAAAKMELSGKVAVESEKP